MINYSNSGAEVCVIGRCNFENSIGMITYAACELLARSFPVCILPTEPGLRSGKSIRLPSGRAIPICRDTNRIRASLFTEIVWNGTHDRNFFLMPKQGLRLATVTWDSDEFPPEWIRVLNDFFDGVVCLSPHLEEVLRADGLAIPTATVPLALDIEALLSRPVRLPTGRFRFGSIAAFHPRKGLDVLLEAYSGLFGNREDVELVLHSSLSFGNTLSRTKDSIKALGLTNAKVSTAPLSSAKKNELIASFDVFANFSRGEGYSIGAREALALGKVVALSDVGAHKNMAGLPGVFFATTDRTVPARFPEVDNRIFGTQRVVSVDSAIEALRAAHEFALSGQAAETAYERRSFAADLSFGRLSAAYAELIDPDLRAFRAPGQKSSAIHIPTNFQAKARARVSDAGGLSHIRYRTIPAHDGGFFSVFNVFLSHLVWDSLDERCHRVLPDWDVGRMIEREGSDSFVSFCYGQPEDGNLWTKLFEPLYGLTDAEMNDGSVLYQNASIPTDRLNVSREPFLTYIHAYRLYQQPWFPQMRRQYHRVLEQHVRVRPALQAEIDGFVAKHLGGKFMIAAHVRHPSHVTEQPTGSIATAESYIDRIYRQIGCRSLQDDAWGIFLATDQQRVVEAFEQAFGDRVAYFPDVRRTTAAEDSAFNALPADQQRQDRHQLQHLVASTRETWSTRMAWEVLRDAYVMARCDLLLHVVSNVSTGVAFLNPDIHLEFCD